MSSSSLPNDGDIIATGFRQMTRERMRWYADALVSTSEPEEIAQLAGENIHTDDEFARSQGLSGIISDGMITTNWLSGLLFKVFGEHYLSRGTLTTKYVKPVFEDELIDSRVRVTQIEQEGSSVRYHLDVWCERSDGVPVTVGTASVLVTEQNR